MIEEKKSGFLKRLFGDGCNCRSFQLEEGPGTNAPPAAPKKGGLWIALGSGIMAVIAGVGCCGLPIISGILAVFGVGSAFFLAIKPWQPFFIALAIAALAYEFYKAYRPLSGDNACCSRTGKRLMLWCVTIVMSGLLILQHTAKSDASAAQALAIVPSTDKREKPAANTETATPKASTSCSSGSCAASTLVTHGKLEARLSEGEKMRVTVMDMQGKTLGVHTTLCCDILDITSYDNGAYLLQVESPGGYHIQPIRLKKNSCCP